MVKWYKKHDPPPPLNDGKKVMTPPETPAPSAYY